MRRMPRPEAASSEMIRWTSTLAPMSIPRVGSSRMRIRGSVAEPLAQDDLLLVAAGQVGDGLVDAGRPDLEAIGVALGDGPLGRRPDEQAWEQPVEDRQGDVRRDREVEDEAVLVTVLGDVGDPRVHRRRRAVERDGRPAEHGSRPAPVGRRRTGPGRPRSDRPRPGRPSRRSRRPGSTNETSSNDSARVRSADLEQHIPDGGFDLREERDRPADHVPDEVARRQLGRRLR